MRHYSTLSSNTHLLSIHQSNINKFVTGAGLPHHDVDLTEDSEDGPVYTFQSCTFNGLSNSGNGGAITCSASSTSSWKPQLIIKQSTFNSCESSSGHGGGVYVEGVSSSLVDKTIFTNCKSLSQDAGAIFFTSFGYPSISNTVFISCCARLTDGYPPGWDDGGACLLDTSFSSDDVCYIIQSCRFISCRTFNLGGAAHTYSGYCTIGFNDSLFTSCKSNTAEFIGIHLGTEKADALIC